MRAKKQKPVKRKLPALLGVRAASMRGSKPKAAKAWGLLRKGRIMPLTGRSKSWMTKNYTPWAEVVRVSITIVEG